jgi:signal transduction histidine kinase
VVISVPLRAGDRFGGMVAGMVPVSAVSDTLEKSSIENRVALVGANGTVIGCLDFSDDLSQGLRAQMAAHGAEALLAATDGRLTADGETALCTPAEMPDRGPWWVMCYYDEAAYLRASGLPSTFQAWIMAGLVLVLGATVMFLTRLVGSLVRARDDAETLQLELSHVARISTMGELATGFAHELSQPLAAVANYLAASEERIRAGASNAEELLADLSAASAQTERAGNIVEELRAFLRKGDARRAILDANALVHDVLTLMAPALRKARAHVDLALGPEALRVCAVRVQIQQVLVNILQNAIEACAAVSASCVTIATRRTSDDKVEFALTDNGSGITAEARRRLFDPFFTTKPQGMGLGLSIVRTIVKNHGGQVALESAASGTTVRFTLPAASDGTGSQ